MTHLSAVLPGMSDSVAALNGGRERLAGLARDPGARALESAVAAAVGPGDAPGVLASRRRSAVRSDNARAAQATGAALENILDEHHGRAWVMGLADLEHQHPRVYRTQDGALHYGDKSGPDYRGTLRGGRALAVEAKSAGLHRLGLQEPPEGHPARERFDGVKRHQADALTRCEKLGGVALLVVRFVRQVQRRPVASLYAVPWGEIAHLNDIGPDDVAPWRVTGDCYLERFVPARHTLASDPIADELLPLGWRRDVADGWWVDPSRGRSYPFEDALRLARKDSAGVAA